MNSKNVVKKILSELPNKIRSIIDAEYVALAIMDHNGQIIDFFTSGMSKNKIEKLGGPPVGKGLLGFLHKNQTAIRLKNLETHPHFVGFPKGHPKMSSFLGIPIGSKKHVYGNLYLTNKKNALEFSDHDQEIVELMAEYIVMAIENYQLYDRETQLLNDTLKETQKLTTIVENVSIGIILTDSENNIVLANKAAELIFGITLRQGHKIKPSRHLSSWISQDGSIIWNSKDPMDIIKIYQNLEKIYPNLDIPQQDITTSYQEGKKKNLSFSIIPISQINSQMFLTVIQDTTEIQELENAKSDFLSMITHDLRGPLSTIQSLTSSLNNITSIDNIKDIASSLKDESENMSSLVSNLLSMARIESGTVIMDPEVCHIIDIANECRTRFYKSRHKNTHTIHIDIDLNLPSFYADHFLVLRILNNLIENAAKYSPYTQDIWISASLMSSDPSRIQVKVTDNGIGISEEDSKKIFNKFYRLTNNTTNTNRNAGLGLGLAICKNLVELHNGSLSVSSQINKGTVFTFDLPIN